MKLAACGNDCNECPRFVATQKADAARLRQVGDLWKRAAWRTLADATGALKNLRPFAGNITGNRVNFEGVVSGSGCATIFPRPKTCGMALGLT